MNKKGVTMVTVVVIIIVMLIIATVSIVAGNKIIINSKELSEEQELQSVKAAVLRKKSEFNMSGTLVPLGEKYVGIGNPILRSDGTDTIVAKGWYLLEEENLEKLGVYDVTNRYLVNYDYEVVLSLQNEDYLEEYMVVEFMHKCIEDETFVGTELTNKDSSGGLMVKNKQTGELYGTGWYLLKKDDTGVVGDFPTEYSSEIKHDYLINFKTNQYVKMDTNFEQI